jgi:hypothetical protein
MPQEVSEVAAANYFSSISMERPISLKSAVREVICSSEALRAAISVMLAPSEMATLKIE